MDVIESIGAAIGGALLIALGLALYAGYVVLTVKLVKWAWGA